MPWSQVPWSRVLRWCERFTLAALVVSIGVVAIVGIGSFPPVVPGGGPRQAAAEGWGRVVGGVPEAIVIVTEERTIARWESSGRGGPRWVCGYHPIVAPMHSVLDPSPVVDWITLVAPVEGHEYMLGCFVETDDGGRTLVRSRYVVFESADVFSGIAETERAIDEARRRLPLPDPDPVVNPPTEQLVGLPMWMWLERPWQRVSAVASVGDTWAAVAAFPIGSHWTFSDGSGVWCDRGVPYDTGRPAREQSSTCTHAFQHSSSTTSDGMEWVRVTMTWKVEWYSSEGGGEPLGTVERTTVFPVRVVEAQAVVR